MGMTPKQIEDRLYNLIDEVAALEGRLKDLENPNRLRQMKARGFVAKKGGEHFRWDTETAMTVKWSAIGNDPELIDFVKRTNKDKDRIEALKKISSCLLKHRAAIVGVFSTFGVEGKLVRVKYRGSVVRGIKAYHKGKMGSAKRFKVDAKGGFDCDAFVEMPDGLWDKFVKAGFKRKKYNEKGAEILGGSTRLDNKRRYVSLPGLIIGDEGKKPVGVNENWLAAILKLKKIEGEVSEGLGKIEGYRKIGGKVDFEFYLRPVANVWWTYKERNPYFAEQDLNFNFQSLGAVEEFCYKDLENVKEYVAEKGILGKLAPDIQCVIGKSHWYLETEEVFEWIMARREVLMALPGEKRFVHNSYQKIKTLIDEGKIVGGTYT